MNGIWEKWFREKDIKKWFKKDNLIVLILTGVLLVIIALPTKDSGETGGLQAQGEAPEKETTKAPTDITDTADPDGEYARQLEQRLRETLSRMEGVGQVRVMITLKSSQELVVEKEQPYLRASTNENDGQGGNRTVTQLETEENTVYRTDGSVSEPYVIKTLPPQIEGVVVVAEGAGSGTVNRTIVEMIQALFGVEAHKVKVVKMEVTDDTR
ncbi:MAG: stage III sporulation protein AG [Acetatifactor sp.]|nr:stage III sporulation protein AG [Acetatifactor sp.]